MRIQVVNSNIDKVQNGRMGHQEYLPSPEPSHLRDYMEVKKAAVSTLATLADDSTSLVGRTVPGSAVVSR